MDTLKSTSLGSERSFHAEYLDTGSPVLTLGISPISIKVKPGDTGGTPVAVKVQYTTSPVSDIEAGTATWTDWPSGAVTVETDDVLIYPVAAVRLHLASVPEDAAAEMTLWGAI